MLQMVKQGTALEAVPREVGVWRNEGGQGRADRLCVKLQLCFGVLLGVSSEESGCSSGWGGGGSGGTGCCGG